MRMMQYWKFNKEEIKMIGHEREDFGHKYASMEIYLQPDKISRLSENGENFGTKKYLTFEDQVVELFEIMEEKGYNIIRL